MILPIGRAMNRGIGMSNGNAKDARRPLMPALSPRYFSMKSAPAHSANNPMNINIAGMMSTSCSAREISSLAFFLPWVRNISESVREMVASAKTAMTFGCSSPFIKRFSGVVSMKDHPHQHRDGDSRDERSEEHTSEL